MQHDSIVQRSEDASVDRILEHYRQITGLQCYYLEIGRVLNGFTQLDGCEYCTEVQKTHDGLYKCSRQRHLALKEAIAKGEDKTFRCHAGLVEWIVPIFSDNEVKGFFCSGFVAEPFARDNLRRQKNYFSQRYGIAEDTLLETIEHIRVIDKDQIKTLSQLLKLIVRLDFKTGPSDASSINLQLPAPGDFYDSLGTYSDLKALKYATYRDMYAKARSEGGANGVRKLREELNDMQEQLCRCIADNRTVEAKDLMVALMTPAYQDPDPAWRIYEVNKRFDRISKRLHDYFGFSDELDQGKFEIFQHLIKSQTQKEVRLASNDFFHLMIQCFCFKEKEKPLDVFERARAYISDNYVNGLHASDVAQAVGVSPDYLNRVFRSRQGVSLKKYISLMQISKVKELLEDTDWSIEAIAESLNYNSVRSLYRTFAANVGMTCGEYRLLYHQHNADT